MKINLSVGLEKIKFPDTLEAMECIPLQMKSTLHQNINLVFD